MSQPLPTTLQETIQYFSDKQRSIDFVVAMRWPHGPICPRCQSPEYNYLKTRSVWECKGCKKQYSVKVGTIFEDSAIKLDKWICAMWMIVNAKNGVSSYEIHRSIGVTQKTAWFMMTKNRLWMPRPGGRGGKRPAARGSTNLVKWGHGNSACQPLCLRHQLSSGVGSQVPQVGTARSGAGAHTRIISGDSGASRV